MPPEALFPDDPEDTRVAILQATYEALVEHGYADLTIDRIGQRFPKSKSLLYHHYDGKDDLLLDFLAYLLGTFEADLGLDQDANPHERLTTLLDRVLSPEEPPGPATLRRAIVQLRAQGASDPEYRQHFTDHDRFFKRQIADIVAEGVADGTYREVDPEAVAATLHTLVAGAMLQRATAEAEDMPAIRAEVDAYLEARVLADGR